MNAKRYLAMLLAIIVLAHMRPAFAQAPTPTPLPTPAPRVPFNIEAPWPAGRALEAGDAGSFYGDGGHVNEDYFALDFNHPTTRADAGMLVLAAADGVVVDADCNDNGSYGCRVVVGHQEVDDYCYQSLYAHLQDSLLVTETVTVTHPVRVTQGQPLGRIGSTGLAPGSDHLHFAIHRKPRSECNDQSAAYYTDRTMAVVPVPLAGVDPVRDAIDPDVLPITSRTYPVGLPALTDAQIDGPDEPPAANEEIVALYQSQGGTFSRFGPANGPTQSLNDLTYQEFDPYAFDTDVNWYGLAATIVARGRNAYFMYQPIWEIYRERPTEYGYPTTHSYEWSRNGGPVQYRTDFTTGRSILMSQDGQISEITASEDAWDVFLHDTAEDFNSVRHYRRDPYLDFSWPDVTKPGPFETPAGFSGAWETTVHDWLPAFRINVSVQGYVRIYANGNLIVEEDSPDQVTDISNLEFGVGQQRIEVRYWQRSGQGKLNVSVQNPIIRTVLASEGTVTSQTPTGPSGVVYGTFTPALRDGPDGLQPIRCTVSAGQSVTLHETTTDGATSFVACINLADPYLRFEMVMANDTTNVNATPDQRETVASIVARAPYAERRPLLAFNADYFGAGHGPEGFTVHNGQRLDGPANGDHDGEETARSSQAFGRANSVTLGRRSEREVSDPLALATRFYNASGGGPLLVHNGAVVRDPCAAEGFDSSVCRRTNQTGVGLSADGRTYIVIAAENVTAEELGERLLAYGAVEAIKLDGGGSTQLWYDGATKIGGDRPVANALVVFRERIPRHAAALLTQSRFPVVAPGAPLEMAFTLRNTGFLPWQPGAGYALRNIDGNALGLQPVQDVTVPIATNQDINWVLPALAPASTGRYTTRWQMVYSGEGGEELIGPPIEYTLYVLPGLGPDGAPDLESALRILLANLQAELQRRVAQVVAELQRQAEEFAADLLARWLAELRAAILRELPPELQCLAPLMVLAAVGVPTLRRRRRR